MTAGSVAIYRTDWIHHYDDADYYSPLDALPWNPVRTIDMTIENRGAAVRLRRNQRAVWTNVRGEERVFYGAEVQYVELRVWHDGSVTLEEERRRG